MQNWFSSQRILVPFDFSERAAEALQFVCEVTGPEQKIHVQHVMIDWYPTHPAVVLTNFDEESFTAKTREELVKAVLTAGLPLERVELSVAIGDPGTKITDAARELPASLIVIPSHGRRGVSRLLLGSVAERVVRLAHCPVLVLKEHEAEA